MTGGARAIAAAVLAAIGWAASTGAPAAHKTVVSKFTYHQHVRPILEAKCGRCHVDGGVARSLLTYGQAAESPWVLQQELLSRRMPPFGADLGLSPIKGHQSLTTIEFDTLMTWAAGGTPEGTPSQAAAPKRPEWPLGTPDAIAEMAQAVTLAADQTTVEREVVFGPPSAQRRLIRAIDLQPGEASMLRRAELSVRGRGTDQVVGVWLPGDVPQPLERNAAFELPANASIVGRLRYARPAGVTGSVADRSRLGIYFARTGAPIVRSIVIGDDLPTPPGSTRTILQSVSAAAHLVAVRQISGPDEASIRLTLIDRGGARVPFMRMTMRPDWPRRYVLQSPIVLPPGSSVEVSVTASQASLWQTLIGESKSLDGNGALRVALETVP